MVYLAKNKNVYNNITVSDEKQNVPLIFQAQISK